MIVISTAIIVLPIPPPWASAHRVGPILFWWPDFDSEIQLHRNNSSSRNHRSTRIATKGGALAYDLPPPPNPHYNKP